MARQFEVRKPIDIPPREFHSVKGAGRIAVLEMLAYPSPRRKSRWYVDLTPLKQGVAPWLTTDGYVSYGGISTTSREPIQAMNSFIEQSGHPQKLLQNASDALLNLPPHPSGEYLRYVIWLEPPAKR